MNDHNGERTPPQDLAAEQGVLGGMLLHVSAINEVGEVLKGGEFYAPKHEQIYAAIVDLNERGEPADAVTVASELGNRGELTKIGGPAYLHELLGAAPSAANAGWHAEIVKAKWRRRGLIGLGNRFVQMGHTTDDVDIDEVVDRAQQELYAAAQDTQADEQTNLDALEAIGEDLENPQIPGVPTGFADLDALTEGLKPGDITIIAARSGMGKSTLCLDVHRHVSMRLEQHSLMFSLEMTRKDVMRRALSAEARISTQHLRYGGMTDQDWDAYKSHFVKLGSAPFHVVDDFGITLAQVRARARRMAEKHPLKLISVDYLQRLTTGQHRPEARQQEVTAISNGLKNLAGELNVPIIAVCQLSRAPEARKDKRPELSDLRESGSLEQDASLVIMPFREDYYEKESPRAGEADLLIRKNRYGPTCEITVAFQGHYSRFVDMAAT